MKDKNNLVTITKQFIKFGIVGISNTIISLTIYYLFIWISDSLYIVGNTAGFIVSVINAYFWNKKFVFQKQYKGNAKPLLRTFISYGSTFLVSTVLLFFWVGYLGISETIAPIINLLITIPLNFLLNKFWTFK